MSTVPLGRGRGDREGMVRPALQRGLTLIELMVALVVGLILMAGVAQVYISDHQSFLMQSGLAQVQESGRFAMSFLNKDIRMAGYSGCGARQISIDNVLTNPSAFLYDFAVGIQGFEGQAGGWSPTLPSELSSLTDAPIPGTDVLTVRSVQGTGQRITVSMPSTSADVEVTALNPPGVYVGEIVLLSDCTAATVFQITNYTLSNGNVVHNTGVDVPGNATKNLGAAFRVGSELQQMATVSYFIASRSGASNCDAGDCGLWQMVGSGPARELVGGIEDLQVRYGVDTDGDSVPNEYLQASAVTDWSKVVSVRLSLLAESEEAAGDRPSTAPSYKVLDTVVTPPLDGRVRRVFNDAVAIRNRTS